MASSTIRETKDFEWVGGGSSHMKQIGMLIEKLE